MSIHAVLDAIDTGIEEAVLATIIHVNGSAYRREGTSMLFGKNQQVGVISAGCLEADLALQAEQLRITGEPSKVVYYDMTGEDDLTWGRAAGCDGKLHILLEVVDERLAAQLLEARQCLRNRCSVTVTKILSERQTVESSSYERGINEQISMLGLKGKKFTQYYVPKPRLFLLGAGDDAQPLAEQAYLAGFEVTVWDWRPALCQKERFPTANVTNVSSLPDFLVDTEQSIHDAIVVMTHVFEKDRDILDRLLQIPSLGYLGVLGPRRRCKRLLQDRIIPEHVHSPVGLKIAAEGPEEIAISILAEVIAVRRAHLRERGLVIERQADSRHLFSSRI